jgi:GNAT superfamily N-acetyltransferase
MSSPRHLQLADVPGAMRLKEAAHWNQTESDWRNVMRLEPDGCFGIDCDGRLAATATAVRYGTTLAWIGMVLTDPAYRGRGFARCLMEHSVAWLQARGVEWIKLDATDMGRPLYAKLGFADECAVERWARPPADAARGEDLPAVETAAFLAMDRAGFGADRGELLRMLGAGDTAAVAGEGYAMGRKGSKAAYFGPCVAQSSAAAGRLLAWYVSRHAGETIYWDLLPENRAAVDLARGAGFAPLRHLVRMALPGRRGAAEPVRDSGKVFAIAGFEYG